METEEERQARRRARLEQMKKEKRRRELLYKWGIPVVAGLAVMIGIGIGIGAAALSHKDSGQVEAPNESQSPEESREGGDRAEEMPERFEIGDNAAVQPDVREEDPAPDVGPFLTLAPLGGVTWEQSAVFCLTDGTKDFTETNLSKYGIFIDVQTGEILAQREAYTRMNPASMTKMLTILVAAEHLTAEDLDQTAPITIDITDYSFANECSNTGYALDERVTVRDMFYGTILPSGADSAVALAIYVAGSHEAFVDMMNEKLAQMGLGETSHMTNCVGVYDEAHYSTAYDMAVILKAAVDNPFCRDVMAAHTYNTSMTPEHPEGLLISNWFLRRIEDKDTHGEVLCAKTGYVDQSGSCAASLGLDRDGREYLCVTAGSSSTWTCIYDQVELYQTFLPEIEDKQEGDA
ncbi:MAG: D-alanyl-D-alanine carboxypeptidase [Lachnospiraceae bacterium]|nr:D-alanyl-D-alanine carboxypeptidase [Lachnospiraceae bacterium]